MTMTSVSMRLVFLLVLLSVAGARAWWESGHMVTGEIARRFMDPEALRFFNTYVDHTALRYRRVDDIVQQACWLDDTMNYTMEFFHWHFTNRCYNPDGTPCPVKRDIIYAPLALATAQKWLLTSGVSPTDTAFYVDVLLHVSGDAHQPLHTCTRVDRAHPLGDEGGNLVEVVFEGQKLKLHEFYDSVGMLMTNPAPRPFKEHPASEAYIHNFTDWLLLNYNSTITEKEATNTNFTGWLEEGFHLCETMVYANNTLHSGQELSSDYVRTVRHVLLQRLLLAGRRIAAVFSSIYRARQP